LALTSLRVGDFFWTITSHKNPLVGDAHYSTLPVAPNSACSEAAKHQGRLNLFAVRQLPGKTGGLNAHDVHDTGQIVGQYRAAPSLRLLAAVSSSGSVLLPSWPLMVPNGCSTVRSWSGRRSLIDRSTGSVDGTKFQTARYDAWGAMGARRGRT
jgi:hypothetical protein